MSVSDAENPISLVSEAPILTDLFWNFLLASEATDAGFDLKKRAKSVMRQKLPLADIMPAVMSTCPASVASANAWLKAVMSVQKVARSRLADEADLQESIEELLAAGMHQSC